MHPEDPGQDKCITKKPVLVVCQSCGVESYRGSKIAKFCLQCALNRIPANKLRCKEKNPEKHTESIKKSATNKRIEMVARGAAIAEMVKPRIYWPADHEIDTYIQCRVKIKYNKNLSKNAAYGISRRGFMYIKPDARQAMDDVKKALRPFANKFKKAKTWIDIFVEKPHNRGDAINFIDSICDAVKIAIGVDDKFFSIRKVDWKVNKQNPRIFIGISQESDEETFICIYCGRECKVSAKSCYKNTCVQCSSQEEFEKYCEEYKNPQPETEDDEEFY